YQSDEHLGQRAGNGSVRHVWNADSLDTYNFEPMNLNQLYQCPISE
ncbi:unnamed protein product, partial [marine sediment metagenome]